METWFIYLLPLPWFYVYGTVYTGSMWYTYAIFNVYNIHILYMGNMEPYNYGNMVHIYYTSTMVPRIWFWNLRGFWMMYLRRNCTKGTKGKVEKKIWTPPLWPSKNSGHPLWPTEKIGPPLRPPQKILPPPTNRCPLPIKSDSSLTCWLKCLITVTV